MNNAVPDDVKRLIGDDMIDIALQDDDVDYESFIKEYSPEAICQGEDGSGDEGADAANELGMPSIPTDDEFDPPSAEFADYWPSRNELLQLARYWTKESLSFVVNYYLFGFTGGYESRLAAISGVRLRRIARLVGDEAVQAIATQVEDEYRRSLGDRIWEIFTKGSRAEVDAVRAEISESMRYGLGIAPRAVPKGLLRADIGVQDYKPETWRDFTAYCETVGLPEKLAEQVRKLWEEFRGRMEEAGEP
jgi:hypothetical protein